MSNEASVSAIRFALETDDGLEFLRLWNEGEFDAIRRFWPEAPEAIYIGADPTIATEEEASSYYHGPVWCAFGLGRAAYAVFPRRSLQSMPYQWQQRFVELVNEAHAYLPDDAFPEYTVRRRIRGKFAPDPLADYRHTGPIAPKAEGGAP